MKTKIIRLICGVAAAVVAMGALAFAFTGCGEDEVPERTSYVIDAELDVENMTVTATESVHWVNTSDGGVTDVRFHLYPAAFREGAAHPAVEERYVSSAYPRGVDYGGISVSGVTVNGEVCDWSIGGSDEDILIVSVPELMPGESADIFLDFVLDLPQVRHRFGYYDGMVNLGNWYPVAAVRENGEWREDPYWSSGDPFLTDVADYEVSLTAPTGWIVAGTGSVTTEVNGDSTTTSFRASDVRDFAMSASDKYTCLEGSVGDVTVRYYHAGDTDAQARLDLAVSAVQTFSDMFGDYAYDSLTVVRTPFVFGGMEYPQTVFVSDELDGELLNDAVIHEIAHQWWYAAVGNDQINDAWMDEGLAEYSATLFYERTPDLGIDASDRIADAMQSYVLYCELYSDRTGGDTSMDRGLGEYASSVDYNFHAYVKGELFFDSLRHAVGDDDFFAALRSYYSSMTGEIATPEDLVSCFEEASGMDLGSYVAGWVEGTVGLY